MSAKPKDTLVTVGGEHYKISRGLAFVWWVDYWMNSSKTAEWIMQKLKHTDEMKRLADKHMSK